MKFKIISLVLIISSSFATGIDKDPMYIHQNKSYFESFIFNSKDKISDKLYASKIINIISTGKGAVDNMPFSGIGDIGTNTEHKMAFDLLAQIGSMHGNDFYISFGSNYDFVNTAIRFGVLYGKSYDKKESSLKSKLAINKKNLPDDIVANKKSSLKFGAELPITDEWCAYDDYVLETVQKEGVHFW